jgi:hypothetical protein
VRGRALAGLLLAGASLSACQGGGERRDFGTFSIELPRGWTAAARGRDDDRPGRAGFGAEGASLAGPGGEYVEVLRDVGTGLPDADSWWLAEIGKDGRLTFKERQGLCTKAPPGSRTPEEDLFGVPSCIAGDGRLDAVVVAHHGQHGYVLLFGNTRRESPPHLEAPAKVLETPRAK